MPPAPPEMCTPPHSPMPASPLPSPPADEEELPEAMDVDPEAMDVDEELLPVYPSLHRTRGGLRVHLGSGSHKRYRQVKKSSPRTRICILCAPIATPIHW